MSSCIDLTGQTFGRLFVLARRGSQVTKHGTFALWRCRCICGKKITTRGTSLRFGSTKSCGCLNREISAARLLKVNFRHGMTHTPEYRAYQHAKKRCTNPRDAAWKDYGGRGIEFQFISFDEFFRHLGAKPSPRHSLDRIENNGHYAIGNVKWSTKLEQMNNRRTYATTKRICCADCGSTNFRRLIPD